MSSDDQKSVLKVYIISIGIFGLISLGIMLGFKYAPKRKMEFTKIEA